MEPEVDGQLPMASGGPAGPHGGDGGGHPGSSRQLRLGQRLHAPVQRHGPGLEAVQAGGQRRGELPSRHFPSAQYNTVGFAIRLHIAVIILYIQIQYPIHTPTSMWKKILYRVSNDRLGLTQVCEAMRIARPKACTVLCLLVDQG